MEVDFSHLDLATAMRVDEVLRHDYNERLARAAARQRRIAFLNELQRPLAKDGFGERTFMIDPVFDAYWREYYGKEYTHDPELMRFLAKRNPEITVRSLGTKQIFVGWMPGSTSRRPVGLTEQEKQTGKENNMKKENKWKALAVTALVAVAASLGLNSPAGTLTNATLAANNAASGVTTTNAGGTTLPVLPYKDAVIYAGFLSVGTNAPTAAGTLGFNLYDSTTGQWTTTQPVTASVTVFSNGVNTAVYRSFIAATNLYGASAIRWDTVSLTGTTNGLVTNVDFIQIP